MLSNHPSLTNSYLLKDGRKISVGDCALFKHPQDSPPFVGIIRCLTSVEESNLTLCVNWLYRPAEVKIGKGVAPEAAPNEVFYSFHSDEIPAASLLHPCKVAFLPKGVELPLGVSSFVCRRVYDITHKCLWWLTDQDFVDDRQKEVDQLLHKTRKEMHVTAQHQQGARSPKPVNDSAATSPLKHSPDSVQNSSSNISSHKKGKKRERGDQSSEHIKRERSVRADEGDSEQLRSESNLKLEIAKISERGLVDSEMVDRLVQLMQPEKSERKIDLTGRSMLAGIIASSDNVDCLSKFVQLKGLPVLDEWLQEVHRGKVRDRGNIKYGDITVENFLLVLLRALDKLPVNLNALQMCNIGKSVNHLRSHKNIEIQKKARSLVDTWKKRVEAEMNINDSKSGSVQSVAWPGKSRHGSPHGGNRHSSGSSEAAIRSSITHHSSLKSSSVKLVQGDTNSKYASVYPVGARSTLSPASAAANKDEQSRLTACGASSEPPQVVVKEEKSSSSCQSHNNSQCSSDHARILVPSGKEDAKSSTAGSRILNKITGSGSKHRKSDDDLQGSTCIGQRENVSSRGTSRTSAVDKPPDNVNASVHEVNNSHKLIVKIPNRGRTAAQSIAGVAVEDSSCRNSRASSPALLEKHDISDACLKEKQDCRQSSDVDGLSTSVHHKAINDNRRLPNASKVASSPSGNDMKPKKTVDSSFSSMNALIESCVKFSEANIPMSSGDDVGMNLLASVAAGEIPKSATASPSVSPNRDSAAAKNSCSNDYANKKQLQAEGFLQQSFQPCSIADADKRSSIVGVTSNLPGTSVEILRQNEEVCLKRNGKLDEEGDNPSLPTSSCASGRKAADGVTEILDGKSVIREESQDQLPVANQQLGCSFVAADKAKNASLDDESEKRVYRDAISHSSADLNDGKDNASQVLQNGSTLEPDILVAVKSESVSANTKEKTAVVSSCTGQELAAENSNEFETRKADGIDLCAQARLEHNSSVEENRPPITPKQEESVLLSSEEQNNNCKDENVEKKESLVHQPGDSAKQASSCAVDRKQPEVNLSIKGSDVTAAEEEKKGDLATATGNASLLPTAGGSETEVKLGFDLNEGFSMDDGRSSEPSYLGAGPCSTAVCSASSLLLPVSSVSCGLPASITVASAAKGPFVPPDDLLRYKTELGWKGSAATSAFRPAEPRKLSEVPSGPSNSSLLDASPCKQARPPLDIDLNVADERTLLDVGCQTSVQESNNGNTSMYDLINSTSLRCSGGLDLDLNKVDEAADVGQHSVSNYQKLKLSTPPGKLASSIMFSSDEAGNRRDFDLNNGPATEEMLVEKTSYSQYGRSNISSLGPFGSRINSSDAGNSFAWYPPGSGYSVSVTPSALPDREVFPIGGAGSVGPQRVMGGPTSNLAFNPDAYRGSMLSSTPTLPFNTTPFQYPVFPFGASFPLPTSALSGGSSGFMDLASGGRVSAIPSQLVGTAASVPFQYPHAYVVSRPVPDVGNNGVIESIQKRGKQRLDLNSGPGSVDAEGRDESLPTASRHLSAISSQSFAEEQARLYSMAGGVLKRKEPEGGWNVDKLNFKQSSWR